MSRFVIPVNRVPVNLDTQGHALLCHSKALLYVRIGLLMDVVKAFAVCEIRQYLWLSTEEDCVHAQMRDLAIFFPFHLTTCTILFAYLVC